MNTRPHSSPRRGATVSTLRVAERTAVILTCAVMLGVIGLLAVWILEGLFH